MNKMVKIGIVCLIVALGLVFAGCDEFTKAEFGSVGKVSNVAVKSGTFAAGTLVITWDAASGADGGYDIVGQQLGKKDIFDLSIDSSPVVENGAVPDTNKWTTEAFGKTDFPQTLKAGEKARLGVRANSIRADKNPSIVWFGEYEF